MKRNGFTLIELLAVIVILAIIALIATPIILGIITDARKKSEERSVELYASAVKNAIATYRLNNTIAPESFSDLTVKYDGDVYCKTQILYSDKTIYLAGCTVNDGAREYSYGTQKSDIVEKVCTLNDKDGNKVASLSDVVTCAGESFYVMSNKNNEVTMLSMYNLYVGNTTYTTDFITFKSTPFKNSIAKQNELAKGYIAYEQTYYGTVAFSNGSYWDLEISSSYEYIYDQRSNLYQYVNAYETYLKEKGVKSATATIMSLEQAEELKCFKDNNSCSKAPSWVYSTSYWLGSEQDPFNVWYVFSSGWFGYTGYELCGGGDSTCLGVRPVVTISSNAIK